MESRISELVQCGGELHVVVPQDLLGDVSSPAVHRLCVERPADLVPGRLQRGERDRPGQTGVVQQAGEPGQPQPGHNRPQCRLGILNQILVPHRPVRK